MADWPLTVPKSPLVGSLSVTLDDNLDRFAGQAGVPIVGPKYTAISQRISFQVKMTSAQWDTFYTFYTTTLAFGSLPFNLQDPTITTPTTKVFTFASPPERNPFVNNNLEWLVSVSLIRDPE